MSFLLEWHIFKFCLDETVSRSLRFVAWYMAIAHTSNDVVEYVLVGDDTDWYVAMIAFTIYSRHY